MILPIPAVQTDNPAVYQQKLVALLSGDLDFHGRSSKDVTHDLHAFPAKFPPQLPRTFIEELTQAGDTVLDPMAGSGTTVLEAFLAGRRALGLDIDPLALRLCSVKTTPLLSQRIFPVSWEVLDSARTLLWKEGDSRLTQLQKCFDAKTLEFITYWFGEEAQRQLSALLKAIVQVEDQPVRHFLELAFSAVIITKSGGVSLAFDLAHTRPHKVDYKSYKSPIKEFEKRLQRNLNSLKELPADGIPPILSFGDAQAMPLKNETIDLILTSPPYASNAIDYMRAHKFSLVWFGHTIDTLSQLRRDYIGGEVTRDFPFENLPLQTQQVVSEIAARDAKKGQVLSRYYSEMTRCLREMYRVLKCGKAAVVVVGSSNMRGVDTLTHTCLAEIGEQIGFEVPHIGVRRLDRDRRMLPARRQTDNGSQIENRMHEEYVIGFYKPHHGDRLRDNSDLPFDLAI